MSCHAILKNLYEPKMDVILTISFKITVEIEYVCFASYFADEDVYWRFVKLNYVLSFIHCHGICVYIVYFYCKYSWVNAARSSCRWTFHPMEKTFPQGYVISLCGAVVRCIRI